MEIQSIIFQIGYLFALFVTFIIEVLDELITKAIEEIFSHSNSLCAVHNL